MPIFELKCKHCGQEQIVFKVVSTDKVPKRCFLCNGKLERCISTTSFVLKGAGWSKDGYDKRAKAKA
jgi:putative FmdB family regulatory protein